MSAADRMVVRTRSGAYRSLPRRTALGLLAAGRVTLEPAPVTPQAAPVTPEPEPVTPSTAVVPPNPYDLEIFGPTADELDADDSASSADDVGDGSWSAERGPIVYDVPEPTARELPPEPKPTARRADWAAYADSLGVEVTSAMTKREIQQAAEEAATSLANLPQPARTGGRLETPEDEPATETVADDPDTRTR
jgi:hypothetical protein